MSESLLQQLTAMSHELGRPEHGLVILGEGNTSTLVDDKTFYVKGSGSQLATIAPNQFSHVMLEPVLDMLKSPDMSEVAVDQALRAALVNPALPKPSIETTLHALCLTKGGAKFVGHTHAEAVNQVLCSKLGAEPFMQHIFPDAVVVCGEAPLIVPYAEPGMHLAIAFRNALDDYLQKYGVKPKLVLMTNHGIIALGQTAKDVINVTMMAQKWARILVGSLTLGGASYLSTQSVKALDSRLDEKQRRQSLSSS